ncbi:alpha/beta fold hydrolase [Leifsonia sp. Le1]|uniref:alpha/beta fold hydrolase n=1 Tax=Leifsonia sp. Le1 TaxID=3404918 RepID=UPI003EB8DEB2
MPTPQNEPGTPAVSAGIEGPLAVRTTVASAASGDHLPPVILLHGFASSGDDDFTATGWPRTFADAGHTTHVIDLPGHGHSPAVTDAASGTTTSVVGAIVSAIEALGADQVDVVAYSLGARLAWELPAASTGRVRRMVLGGLSPFEPFTAVDLDALRRLTGVGMDAAAASSAPSIGVELDAAATSTGTSTSITKTTTPATDPLTGMMAAMVSAPGADTASLVALIAGLGSEPFAPESGAPDVPVLFVAGSEDPMAGGIGQLVAAVPGAAIVRVPGDHRGALDSAEFRAAAVAFLGG